MSEELTLDQITNRDIKSEEEEKKEYVQSEPVQQSAKRSIAGNRKETAGIRESLYPTASGRTCRSQKRTGKLRFI